MLYCVARPSQNTPRTIRIPGLASHEGVQHPGRQVEDIMTNLKYGVVGATGLALLLSIASVSAQQPAPTRVRGEIAKVDGNTLTVKIREGDALGHQAELVRRHHRHAAAGRHPEGHRSPHLPGSAARRR